MCGYELESGPKNLFTGLLHPNYNTLFSAIPIEAVKVKNNGFKLFIFTIFNSFSLKNKTHYDV